MCVCVWVCVCVCLCVLHERIETDRRRNRENGAEKEEGQEIDGMSGQKKKI